MTVDFNLISFLLAIFSIILGGFAIFQSKEYRDESKSTNEDTRKLLEEIKVHSTVISQYALPELRAYGESIRTHLFQQQTINVAQVAKKEAEEFESGSAVHKKEESSVRSDVVGEINFLTKHTGRALPVELFDRLKHKYPFGTVLSELLIMHNAGIATWAEAPNPPDALSAIELTE